MMKMSRDSRKGKNNKVHNPSEIIRVNREKKFFFILFLYFFSLFSCLSNFCILVS